MPAVVSVIAGWFPPPFSLRFGWTVALRIGWEMPDRRLAISKKGSIGWGR